jgi:hypothetical protein
MHTPIVKVFALFAAAVPTSSCIDRHVEPEPHGSDAEHAMSPGQLFGVTTQVELFQSASFGGH